MSGEYSGINKAKLATTDLIFNNKNSDDTDHVEGKQTEESLQLSSHDFKLIGELSMTGPGTGTVYMPELCYSSHNHGLTINKMHPSYTIAGGSISVAGGIVPGDVAIGFFVDTTKLTKHRGYQVTIKGSPTASVHAGGQTEPKNSRTGKAIFCYDPDFGTGKRPCGTISGAYESDEYGHIIGMEPRTSSGYDANLKITDAPYLGFYVMRAPTGHAIHAGPSDDQDKTFSVTACCIDKDASNIKLEALPIQFNIDGVNNLLT